MCATCGCSTATHAEPHPHEHHHATHAHEAPRTIELEHAVLAHNDHLAEHNREYFAARQVTALNLMSSPGAGKTSLLERTVREFGLPVHVIEGDQETDRDAARIREAGATAVQINTGVGCHLDAQMIEGALSGLALPRGALLMIENVGNLVCPAMFDLGEQAKVVIASVTEGDDKPLKYPHMFRTAGLVILNKVDLLPYVPFDVGRFEEHVHRVNPRVDVLYVSALSGSGLPAWYRWLRESLGVGVPAPATATAHS
jgi:hydrogenase nickel incorporation protein HypB